MQRPGLDTPPAQPLPAPKRDAEYPTARAVDHHDLEVGEGTRADAVIDQSSSEYEEYLAALNARRAALQPVDAIPAQVDGAAALGTANVLGSPMFRPVSQLPLGIQAGFRWKT
mgnify:CR=1 FL=1